MVVMLLLSKEDFAQMVEQRELPFSPREPTSTNIDVEAVGAENEKQISLSQEENQIKFQHTRPCERVRVT